MRRGYRPDTHTDTDLRNSLDCVSRESRPAVSNLLCIRATPRLTELGLYKATCP
jgi:hypothetical protein